MEKNSERSSCKAPLSSSARRTNPSYGTMAASTVEDTAQRRSRWISIIIAYIAAFLMFSQASMYWSSMWPYLKEVDTSATESFFGFVIAAYSLGMTLSAPLLGWWSNKVKATRPPILAGIVVNIMGNVLYVFVESLPSNRKWLLLVARFITGLGAGNMGTLNAYVAMASTLEERNKAISFLAAVYSLAILAGPGIQVAFVPLDFPGRLAGPLHFNMYTAPGYFSIFTCLVTCILLLTMFHEYHIAVDEKADDDDSALKPFDKVAAAACCWFRFVILYCVVYDDTIGSPFTMTMFRWTSEKAVLYNGIIQSISGVLDFFGNMVVGNFVLRFVRERVMTVVGLCSFGLFYVVSFSYPNILPDLTESSQNVLNNDFLLNSTTSTITFVTSSSTVTTEDFCNYSWCSYTTRIKFSQYLIAYVFLVLAFPSGFTPTATLYSKICGPRRQGLFQGVFSAAGSIATTISPIIVSSLFEFYGPRVAWTMGFTLIAVTIVLIACVFHRLVPYSDDDSEKNSSISEDCETNATCLDKSEIIFIEDGTKSIDNLSHVTRM